MIDILLFSLDLLYICLKGRTPLNSNVTTSPGSPHHVESKNTNLSSSLSYRIKMVQCILRVCIINSLGGGGKFVQDCSKGHCNGQFHSSCLSISVFIAPVTNASLNSSNYYLDVTYYDFQ